MIVTIKNKNTDEIEEYEIRDDAYGFMIALSQLYYFYLENGKEVFGTVRIPNGKWEILNK